MVEKKTVPVWQKYESQTFAILGHSTHPIHGVVAWSGEPEAENIQNRLVLPWSRKRNKSLLFLASAKNIGTINTTWTETNDFI